MIDDIQPFYLVAWAATALLSGSLLAGEIYLHRKMAGLNRRLRDSASKEPTSRAISQLQVRAGNAMRDRVEIRALANRTAAAQAADEQNITELLKFREFARQAFERIAEREEAQAEEIQQALVPIREFAREAVRGIDGYHYTDMAPPSDEMRHAARRASAQRRDRLRGRPQDRYASLHRAIHG